MKQRSPTHGVAPSSTPSPSATTRADDITNLYHAAIRACATARQWQLGLELLREMQPPTSRAATAAIHAIARAKQWQSALRVLLDVSSTPHHTPVDVSAWNAMLSVLEKQGHWQYSLELFARMQKNTDVRPDVVSFTAAMRAAAYRADGWRNAMALFEAMETQWRVRPDIECWNTALAVLARHGAWAHAQMLLHRMEQNSSCTATAVVATQRGASCVAPTVASFSACISAYAKHGRWGEALALFTRMQRPPHNIRPNVVVYSATMSACEKAGEWRQAVKLLDAMALENPPIIPDAIAYNACISACAPHGHWGTALSLLQRMVRGEVDSEGRAVRPTVVSYSACIHSCAQSGHWAMALHLLSDMRQHLLRPNVITYNSAISACEKGRKWSRALDIFRAMHCPPDAISYNAAISACEKGAVWREALALFHAMRSSRKNRGGGSGGGSSRDAFIAPTVVTYSSAISACEKGNAWEHALDLLRRMKEDSNVMVNTIAYNAVIRAVAKNGDWRRGWCLIQEMSENGVLPDAISFISCGKGGGDLAGEHDAAWTAFIVAAAHAGARWAQGENDTTRHFIKGPGEAIQLLQLLGRRAPTVFTEKVRAWVLDCTTKAVCHGDVESLARFGLPHLGPFTREALDALGIGQFDAAGAKTAIAAEYKTTTTTTAKSDGVRAKVVLAHVKSSSVNRVARYGMCDPQTERALPSVHLEHDRSAHAERQALLQLDPSTTGIVELFVTHRPCVSCLAAMAAFQKLAPRAELKVAFDELD
eukprot:GEMP01020002.1.p1 GENE.GEMP01020002.1~~GEMP01020002.1.p1  ORF type:complete len:764 (+),score=230.30 GEMP01020002.1:339-2630(+)